MYISFFLKKRNRTANCSNETFVRKKRRSVRCPRGRYVSRSVGDNQISFDAKEIALLYCKWKRIVRRRLQPRPALVTLFARRDFPRTIFDRWEKEEKKGTRGIVETSVAHRITENIPRDAQRRGGSELWNGTRNHH